MHPADEMNIAKIINVPKVVLDEMEDDRSTKGSSSRESNLEPSSVGMSDFAEQSDYIFLDIFSQYTNMSLKEAESNL